MDMLAQARRVCPMPVQADVAEEKNRFPEASGQPGEGSFLQNECVGISLRGVLIAQTEGSDRSLEWAGTNCFEAGPLIAEPIELEGEVESGM